jgi:hypothetical protein
VLTVKEILEASTSKLSHLSNYFQQAQLAADGKMDELKLQDELNGGKAV